MIEPTFNQMQVQPVDRRRLRRTACARCMRQDPDIIMVGEIRDRDTADMAVQAALTGHLVLSTLHTNDAPTAVTRLLDLGVPSYLLNLDVAGRDGAAPGPHACVRTASSRAKPPDDETWTSMTVAVARRTPHASDAAGRVPRMPDDRLLRADGDLRSDAGHADAAAPHHARGRRSRDPRTGVQGRMKPLRCPAR